ncbi:unnamed protein product [Dovyalis caffra]|uniref:Disease resistance N-terminal domain-containing protein n=1 Tax=Dovyalis caffra TaxID=77055 RepID=A0AAV1R820_9ROSI|nr:unnamed protein product [Dovyalis caffra]
MSWCDSMESLPDGMMTVMSRNHRNQCVLEQLEIQGCPSLKSFPRGKLPTTLKELRIDGCEELESEYWFLEGIMQFVYLKFSITSLPTGKFPTSLKTFEFFCCRRIQSLLSLLNLSHLTQLIIQGCDELESFPDQELPLPNLTSTDTFHCKKMRSLPNHMDSLQQLWISNCCGLVSFPETGLPLKLTSLTMRGCMNLRQPISEWRLTSLERLQMGFTSPYYNGCISDKETSHEEIFDEETSYEEISGEEASDEEISDDDTSCFQVSQSLTILVRVPPSFCSFKQDPVLINEANTSISTSLQAQKDEEAEADPLAALQLLVGKLISEWQSRLLQVRAMLNDAEQKQLTNQAMKIWLDKLRDLAYDVEDVLDEFETEALTSKLKGAESQASTSTVQPSAGMPNGPKLQEIAARWEDIMKEKNDLGLDINVLASTSLPSLEKLPALNHLIIEGMDKLRGIVVVNFPSLETLYIGDMLEWEQWYGSDGLNEEPAGGKFPKLVELTLQNCPKLIGKLPRCLPSLKKLHISRCPQLTNLPEMLPSLHEVTFRMVPNFTSLTTLEISGISGLVVLPEAFLEALVALEDLKIEECRELKYLWQDGVDVDKLANLKSLSIFLCKQLVSLVEGERGILPSSLKRLEMRWCDSMDSLPHGMMAVMSSNTNNSNQCLLEELVIENCPSLKSLPTGKLPTTLKKLIFNGCRELESEYRFLEGIIQCDAHLEYLRVSKFSITSFPTGKFPTSLKTIEFSRCRRIQSLPSLHNLSHRSRLKIEFCNELESFSDQELPSLTSLEIFDCLKLRSLPNHMDSLRQLMIKNCYGLVSFPETGLPPKLNLLRVENLRQPISEWRLHTLTSLKRLEISDTTDEDCFPDDDGLLLPTSLTSLHIHNQKKLKSISSGIQHLTSLEALTFWDCPELQVLPKEGFPATLRNLQILNCPLLGERCLKEEGDYWPIIAHIRQVVVYPKSQKRIRSHVLLDFKNLKSKPNWELCRLDSVPYSIPSQRVLLPVSDHERLREEALGCQISMNKKA